MPQLVCGKCEGVSKAAELRAFVKETCAEFNLTRKCDLLAFTLQKHASKEKVTCDACFLVHTAVCIVRFIETRKYVWMLVHLKQIRVCVYSITWLKVVYFDAVSSHVDSAVNLSDIQTRNSELREAFSLVRNSDLQVLAVCSVSSVFELFCILFA